MVFNSRVAAEQHIAIGYRRDRVVIIPNGFDTAQLSPDQRRRQSERARLGLVEGEVAAVMVARFHPLKGHAQLIRAFGDIARCCPRLKLILAGRGCSADSTSIVEAISAAGVGERVLLLGEVADVAGLYSACDVAVCASLSESFPNAIGEAMACGVPCIVPDVGDCAYLVGNTGVVTPAGDIPALAQALLNVANLPAQNRAALGESARQRIKEYFELTAIAGQYADLYRKAGSSCIS